MKLSRRDFVKSSAIFSGLAFVPNTVFGANERLNVAFVGVGGIYHHTTPSRQNRERTSVMSQPQRALIIFPTYNEAENIEALVDEAPVSRNLDDDEIALAGGIEAEALRAYRALAVERAPRRGRRAIIYCGRRCRQGCPA